MVQGIYAKAKVNTQSFTYLIPKPNMTNLYLVVTVIYTLKNVSIFIDFPSNNPQ